LKKKHGGEHLGFVIAGNILSNWTVVHSHVGLCFYGSSYWRQITKQ